MKDAIAEALAFDPLDTAERLTGRDYKTDEGTTLLGIALASEHGRRKQELLADSDDTHFGLKREQWEACIERAGFRLVLVEDIDGTKDKFRIYWRDGLLLRTDSYFDDTSVNSAEVYFVWRGSRKDMAPCSNRPHEVNGEWIYSGGKDAREGIKYFLSAMADKGEFLNPWPVQPWLWLLSYKDPKTPGYDYKAICDARIARLPDDVRSAITVRDERG